MTQCPKCGALAAEGSAFCHLCGSAVLVAERPSAGLEALQSRIEALEREMADYADVLTQHADMLNEHGDDIDGCELILASSDVYHSRFWPRAWAILGHNLAAGAIVYVGVIILVVVLVRR